jgi:hypothetical protein
LISGYGKECAVKRRIWKAALVAGVVMMVATQPAWAGGFPRASLRDKTDAAFQQDCLSAINVARAKHGVPALTTDQKAVDYARSRAQHESTGHKLDLGHDGPDESYGENLFWGSNGYLSSSPNIVPRSCTDAVNSWYGEVNDYDFNAPGYHDRTGSFTQLVWKSTTSVGCAKAAGPGVADTHDMLETYVVCEFTPRGNIIIDGAPNGSGQTYYVENVLPPKAP